jgi:tRNA (guanine37-N1)-methyltransferase
MRFDVITIFPGFFAGVFAHGIVRRAQAEGLVTIEAHYLRAFAHDKHRTVDDRPFGGGEGMVLKPEPLAEALGSLGIAPKASRPVLAQNARMDGATSDKTADPRSTSIAVAISAQGRLSAPAAEAAFAQDDKSEAADRDRTRVILLSAQGQPFTQAMARELAALERVVLICGRYEGVDERINELYCDQELSIGDYVLSGGELAAAVVIDAVMRLIPGVLGNEASGEFESFGAADAEITADQEGVPRSQHGAGGLLDYPHYTRPAEFEGLRVPEVLLNGDHQQIRRWRRAQQIRKTLGNRPDLLESAALSAEDRSLLKAMIEEE